MCDGVLGQQPGGTGVHANVPPAPSVSISGPHCVGGCVWPSFTQPFIQQLLHVLSAEGAGLELQ